MGRRILPIIGCLTAILLCSTAYAQDEGDEQPEDTPTEEPAPEESTRSRRAPANPCAESARDNRKVRVSARVMAGAGGVVESVTANHPYFEIDATVNIHIKPGVRIQVGFRDLFYKRTYLAEGPSPDGGSPLNTLVTDEQMLDARILVGFNPLFEATELVDLHLFFAPRFVYFYNAPFRTPALALGAGLDLEVHPTQGFHILAGVVWGANVLGGETASALGTPLQLADFSAGVGFDFAGSKGPTWTVEMRWLGHGLWLQHSNRIYNGAQAGIGVTF